MATLRSVDDVLAPVDHVELGGGVGASVPVAVTASASVVPVAVTYLPVATSLQRDPVGAVAGRSPSRPSRMPSSAVTWYGSLPPYQSV